MKLRPVLLALATSAALLLSACSKVEPLDRPITAATPDAFAEWRADLGADVTPAQWHDFELAVQEIKILVMNEKGGSSKSVLDEGMRAKVNGKTLREAIALGFQARRDRLERERGEVQARINHDKLLKTKPGDSDSSSYLARVLRADMDRVDMLTKEISAADEKMKAWGVTPAASPRAEAVANAAPSAPAPVQGTATASSDR